MPESRTVSSTSRLASPRHSELVFRGSVSLAVRLHAADLPAGADRSIECYYIQAPRNSYLPLLLPELRRHLIEVVLDEASAAAIPDESLWMAVNGDLWKWHWPIGLLYDYHIASTPSTDGKAHELPLKVTLHLSNPPTDKLPIGPSIEACRTNFMNMVKEADFVRWGSTRRVTGLRKAEQNALWEGVVEQDFDKFWSVASKLVPAPSEPASVLAPAARDVSGDRVPEANAMRSVPIRLYLPQGIPVIQDLVPPVSSEGRPMVLYDVLSAQIPLIFPPRSNDMTASFLAARPLASVIVQGVFVPMDVEVGWLGALMAGADGWCSIVLWPL